MDQRSGDGYSVDDLMSSSSIRGIQMPIFEVLDARIALALNRIIHTSHFRRSNPLFADLWVKTSDKRLSRIYFL